VAEQLTPVKPLTPVKQKRKSMATTISSEAKDARKKVCLEPATPVPSSARASRLSRYTPLQTPHRQPKADGSALVTPRSDRKGVALHQHPWGRGTHVDRVDVATSTSTPHRLRRRAEGQL